MLHLCHIHTWQNRQEKQKFKKWSILEAGACDHGPGPPHSGAEHKVLHCQVACKAA